jgi:hypothetical protein
MYQCVIILTSPRRAFIKSNGFSQLRRDAVRDKLLLSIYLV